MNSSYFYYAAFVASIVMFIYCIVLTMRGELDGGWTCLMGIAMAYIGFECGRLYELDEESEELARMIKMVDKNNEELERTIKMLEGRNDGKNRDDVLDCDCTDVRSDMRMHIVR